MHVTYYNKLEESCIFFSKFEFQKHIAEILFTDDFRRAGKKGGGWEEGIFARLLCPPKADNGWEHFRNSAVSRISKQKNFHSLIEKKLGGAIKKMFRKFFCFGCRRSGANVKARNAVGIVAEPQARQ
jgi:hypothetical protein